jgi:sugar phosphate isomerase/epimerase
MIDHLQTAGRGRIAPFAGALNFALPTIVTHFDAIKNLEPPDVFLFLDFEYRCILATIGLPPRWRILQMIGKQMAQQKLIYHGLVSKFSTLSMDLEIMRAAGFAGLEISAAKMRNVLDAGFTEAELALHLQGIDIPGIGFLLDIERQDAAEALLMQEAHDIFQLAKIAGARGVQVLTGPVQVEAVQNHAAGRISNLYMGVLGRPRDEQMQITARNLGRLADLAESYGLLIYLEALAWSPLNTLADQVELIARCGRGNVRMVVDFWHCYASGDTPETVSKLDKALIYGVHMCDSLQFDGGIPNESLLRDVPTGKGVLDLKAWTEAVKATGYVGWWSCELFCQRQQQDNSFAVARDLHSLMSDLIL